MFKSRAQLQADAEEIAGLREDAEQGDEEIQRYLGTAYLQGIEVPKNPAEAAMWFRKAAELGYAPAQVDLATLLIHGQGVAKNEAEAVAWLHKAAAKGDVTAYVGLGNAYYCGSGVERNDAEARKWLLKCGESGVAEKIPKAMHKLIGRRLKSMDVADRSREDGPEIFITDKNGKRWYHTKVRDELIATVASGLVAVGGIYLGNWVNSTIIIWISVIYIAAALLYPFVLVPKYFKILREKSYRARDREEAERLRPVQGGAFGQQPHGASADEGTI